MDIATGTGTATAAGMDTTTGAGTGPAPPGWAPQPGPAQQPPPGWTPQPGPAPQPPPGWTPQPGPAPQPGLAEQPPPAWAPPAGSAPGPAPQPGPAPTRNRLRQPRIPSLRHHHHPQPLRPQDDSIKLPLLPSPAPGYPAGNGTASDSLLSVRQGDCHRGPGREPPWREQVGLARQDSYVGRWSRAWNARQASRPIGRRVGATRRFGN